MPSDYDKIRRTIEKRGINCIVEPSIDHGEQLTIVAQPSNKRLFSLAKRPSGWFLMGLNGFFHVGRDDHLGDLCERLMNCLEQPYAVGNIDKIQREFLLKPSDFRQWCKDGELFREQDRAKRGWKGLSDEEMVRIWEWFTAEFSFRRGADPSSWPGINEPPGALTWGVGPLLTLQSEDSLAFQLAEESLRRTVISAFQQCTSKGDYVFALDLNHQCYRFDPHDSRILDVSSWPISVAPIGNYHVFISPDLESGIFGHPWEKSLCVFGRKLLQSFKDDNLAVLIRYHDLP